MRKIERLWEALARAGIAAQQRIDAAHAHDIYADFEPPRSVGMVVVCQTRPEEPRPMQSLMVTSGQRADRKWSLRISLQNPGLEPVFAALCEDVIASTEAGVAEADLAAAVARRIQHWRALLEKDNAGLGETTLQGLIGELSVLERRVMQRLPLAGAFASWTGPFGAPQDFRLPSGERIEVKAVRGPATSVQINGLGQLDAGGDPLTLAVVRMQITDASAPGAITAPGLIERLREMLSAEPEIRRTFDRALAALRWHDHPSHDEFAARILGVDAYGVGDDFPKLVVGNVPAGVLDANYTVALVGHHDDWLGD
jgi:Putative  PD-(D/E)XK family member, (DUF4420)